ncbi:hypothetical protein DL765_010385 [Monosporascus sp. GIB2]|nr:hypothetical protein DL765_010385 [Monosporascus sp. GIB2]
MVVSKYDTNVGYSASVYDRLGIGQSSAVGEPWTEIRPRLEISSLHTLTAMLRDTTVSGIPASYDKIFQVGHSFGSRLTYNLAAPYADEAISDGITLTGFSHATFLADTRMTAPISASGRNSSR